jgi:predicted RNA-binding protein associated with RNAse of E/G family
MRHDGRLVDVERRLERDRQGRWHPAERLQRSECGLFYGRAWADHPHFTYSEAWLLPAQGWAVTRFTFRPDAPVKPDWYLEVDAIEVQGSRWHQRDGYLDFFLFEGARYELQDADELAEGMAAEHITPAEVIATLAALDGLCRALHRLRFSGTALLAEFAPDLPR